MLSRGTSPVTLMRAVLVAGGGGGQKPHQSGFNRKWEERNCRQHTEETYKKTG